MDKLFAFADKPEACYKKAKEKIEKLPQSVLARAFRCELVPTEAELAEREGGEYETPGKLQECIKAEKAKMEEEMNKNKLKKKM